MKRILILGSTGMAGHIVEKYFKEKGKYEITTLNRKDVDMSDLYEFDLVLSKIEKDIIINCVGILKPAGDLEAYAKINVCLPRYLEMHSKLNDCKIIHLSTNCVFKGGSNKAEDIPDGTDLYGISKALGEINDKYNLTIRTSITGPELNKTRFYNLFNWFMYNTPEEVTGYNDAVWNGVSTLQLAMFIDECIENKRTGLIHYYTKETVNKAQFLKDLNEIYDLGKKIKGIKSPKGTHMALLEGKFYCEKTLKEQFKELNGWYC